MKIIIFFVIVMVIVVGIGIKSIIDHPCIKSHKENVHHNSWTQWQYIIINGRIAGQYPIFHPAYDAIEDVCDEYKK